MDVNDNACCLNDRVVQAFFASKHRSYRYEVALAFDLDLPRRKAERRFCAVGNPAWMPG